jgi:hypothetical protein
MEDEGSAEAKFNSVGWSQFEALPINLQQKVLAQLDEGEIVTGLDLGQSKTSVIVNSVFMVGKITIYHAVRRENPPRL